MKKQKRPIISVVIPVYNTEPELLSRCLESIERQRFNNHIPKNCMPFEIIIVDDGSESSITRQYLDEISIRTPRINVIHFQNNKGASAARNAGMDAAKGEYVMFVDSDDEIGFRWEDEHASDTGYLYKFLNNAKTNKSELVLGELILQKEDHTPYVSTGDCSLKNERVDRKFALEFLIKRISANSALYSKNLLDRLDLRFDENKIYAEDTGFITEAMLQANRVSTAVNCYYLYKKRPDSLVGRLTNHSEAAMRRIQELRDRIKFYTQVFGLLVAQNKTTNGEISFLISREIALLRKADRLAQELLPPDVQPMFDAMKAYVPIDCEGCGRQRCDAGYRKGPCRKYQNMFAVYERARQDLLAVGPQYSRRAK